MQPVVDMREKAKQEAGRLVSLKREQLFQAEMELKRCEQAVEDCRQQQKEVKTRMLKEAEEGIEAHNIVGYRTHLSDLRKKEEELIVEVEKQRNVVARAETELENALAALIDASKELKVIETHRENWHEQRRREFEKREQKLNDEIGAILYERSERRSS